MATAGVSERKLRTVRVRKRISMDSQDPTQTVLKRTRVVKLRRCPSAGGTEALEDDFRLEGEADPRAFLRVSVPESQDALFGPRYYAEGKLVPHSVIGPADMFEKQHTADMKSHTVEDKSRTDLNSDSSHRRTVFMAARKPVKQPTSTPGQSLQGKLLKIEEGKRKDADLEAQRVGALPIGVKIVEERQRRCLRQFADTNRAWASLSQGLAHRTGKPASALMQNQAQTFRERIEEMDYLDRAVSAEEKAGAQVWYMTLRTDSKDTDRGAYLPVGNLFSGLYAHMKERTSSAEPLIRKPLPANAVIEPSLTRTFRDYPYFQRRMKEEEARKPLRPVQATAPQSIWIQGKAKFEEELQALRTAGLELFRPDFLKPGDLTDEVLAEQYDIKFKY